MRLLNFLVYQAFKEFHVQNICFSYSIGLSEEAAIAQYGLSKIEVLHSKYDTLELQMSHRVNHDGTDVQNQCFTKLIYKKEKRANEDRLIGRKYMQIFVLHHTKLCTYSLVHIFGPHAGEIIQGFGMAFKLRATREDIEDLIGVHPTHAEEVVLVRKSKSNHEDPTKKGC